MNLPGRHAETLTLDTPERSTTGRSLRETAAIVAEALPDDTPPAAAPSPTETPAASAPAPSVADAVAAVPELEEVRRVYGEQGVAQVIVAARQQHVAAESKKLEADPELGPIWRDPEARAEAIQELRTWGASQGYSDQELDNITDARAVRAAWHALQHNKALTAQPDARETPAPTSTSRSTSSSATRSTPAEAEAKRLAVLQEQAAKTGRMRDAARVIEMGLREVE